MCNSIKKLVQKEQLQLIQKGILKILLSSVQQKL